MITILAWIGGIAVAYVFVKLVIDFNKPRGRSILSGPSPRYGFATVGPKKDEGK